MTLKTSSAVQPGEQVPLPPCMNSSTYGFPVATLRPPSGAQFSLIFPAPSSPASHTPPCKIFVNYGADKTNSQLALDFGFADPPEPAAGGFYLMLSLPEDDR